MLVSLRRSIDARRLAAAAGLTMVAAAPAAAQGAAALPPAKDLIAKFVAATNATAVMAKHQSVRTKGDFRAARVPGHVGGPRDLPGPTEQVDNADHRQLPRPDRAGVRWDDGVVDQSNAGAAAHDRPRAGCHSRGVELRHVVPPGSERRVGGDPRENGDEWGAVLQGRMVWKSGRETFDCYSAASGLLVASIGKQESPMGTIEVTNLVSEYKDFGGQKIATRLTQQVMGQEQVLVIENRGLRRRRTPRRSRCRADQGARREETVTRARGTAHRSTRHRRRQRGLCRHRP